jgi:hypothetical protein
MTASRLTDAEAASEPPVAWSFEAEPQGNCRRNRRATTGGTNAGRLLKEMLLYPVKRPRRCLGDRARRL